MSLTVWITVAVILLVVEIITPGVFFFACLSIGAFAAGIVSLFNVPTWLTWAAFITVSIISIYTIRPVALKFFKPGSKKFNTDALLGQKASVVEEINPPNIGMVKVEGELWRAEGTEKIGVNESVEITAVKGTRLIVKKY